METVAPEASRSDQLAQSLLVGLLLAVPVFICLRGAHEWVADPDLGWHLRTAQWIVQHRAFPRADPFSRITLGHPWQAYSWLFELILLKAYNWLNLDGILVFVAAMMTLIAAVLYRMIARLQADFTIRAVLVLAVIGSLEPLCTPRPWLFTIFFFLLEMDILMQTRRDGSGRRLLLLPFLFVVWANVHVQFLDGLIVLGAAACEPLLGRFWKLETRCASVWALWGTLGACVVATFLNPYGPAVYQSVWTLGSQEGVLNTVSEMQAMPFRSLPDYLVLFLALAAAGVLFRYRRLPPFETLMLAMAAILSFRSQRDLWVMAITAGTILAAGIPARARSVAQVRFPLWAWASGAALSAAVMLASVLSLRVDNQHLQSLLAEKMPVEAVAVMKERHYSGPLFNPYNWGGFLIWDLQEPVSIDGRAGLYGDAALDRSRDTWSGKPEWASDPALQSADVVIAPVDAPLTQLLRVDGGFDPVYQDKIAVIFLRRKSGESVASLNRTGAAR